MVELVDDPIDAQVVLDRVRHPHAGATVLFLGSTRQVTDNRETVTLDYEGYEPMALAQLQRLEAAAQERWDLRGCSIVHRLGNVPIGEVSVAVAVSAVHRQAAFEAGQWIIDELKKSVPIWKKESWADGTSEWVHPGLKDSSSQPHE